MDLDGADVKLTLKSGDENNPGNPYGKVTIEVTAGEVRVGQRQFGQGRSWQARPRPELLPRLRAELRAAGFPIEPQLPPPPAGAIFRVLRADSGGKAGAVMIPHSVPDSLPAWKTLFATFDAVARQVSGGVVTMGSGEDSPLVDDAREAS